MNGPTNKRGLAPLSRLRGAWLLSLSLGALWHSPAVGAQEPSVTPTAPMVVPSPSVPSDTLTDDPRLDVRVTMLRRSVTVEDALRELTRQTKIKLAAAGNEAPGWQIAVAVRDEPLRDVLRALAAVNDCHWKRVKAAGGRDALTLEDITDDPRYWDFLRPKTQDEADLRRGVEDFHRGFSRLPPDAQKAFAPGGPGVGYGALPPAMQQGARQAFGAYLHLYPSIIAWSGRPSMTEDDVQNMSVTLQVRPQDGVTDFHVHLTGPWVPEGDGSSFQQGADLSASVPDDPAARDETPLPPNFVPWQRGQSQVVAARFDASRAKALAGDPRLSRPVSIKTEDTVIGFALAALADAAHVNVVAQVFPGAHTVSLASVPLKDALDQVAGKYQAMWGEAADGTILVHYLVHYNEYPLSPDQKTAAK